MIDLYVAAKLGPMNIAAFSSSASAWRKYRFNLPSNVGRALFALMPTVNCRVLQGDKDVLGTAATACMLATYSYFPMVIENDQDRYISIASNNTTAGNLEITLISEIEDWSLTEIT